jgi:hypothetical protein
MAHRLAIVSDGLGIRELTDVCATMRARNLELFERLGGWVTTTESGELQRLFAEACHRHAWHAELWSARLPAIPTLATEPNAPDAELTGAADDSDDDRRALYRAALEALDRDLRSLHGRVDPVLDPSTARTIDLVGRDVADLAGRLDQMRR